MPNFYSLSTITNLRSSTSKDFLEYYSLNSFFSQNAPDYTTTQMSYIVVKKSERDKNGKIKQKNSVLTHFFFIKKIFMEHGHVLSNL
jgi:hypothetical protein